MSHSRLSLPDDARRAVLAGATKPANAVRPTLEVRPDRAASGAVRSCATMA